MSTITAIAQEHLVWITLTPTKPTFGIQNGPENSNSLTFNILKLNTIFLKLTLTIIWMNLMLSDEQKVGHNLLNSSVNFPILVVG